MRQVVVISGKGGTGKTSVTAALASLGKPLVLADCDVDAPDLHLLLAPRILERHEFKGADKARILPEYCLGCGECRARCVYGAIGEELRVASERCEGCGVCHFVCPAEAIRMDPVVGGRWFVSETRLGAMVHAELEPGQESSGRLVTVVRRAARDLAKARGIELVLVDGSPGIGCQVIASLADTDLALIVAEPTVSALHDLVRVHELTRHFGVPALVLLNKCDVSPRLAQDVRDYCQASNLVLAGTLGLDPAFTRAQLQGRTVVECDPARRGEFEAVWRVVEDSLAEAKGQAARQRAGA